MFKKSGSNWTEFVANPCFTELVREISASEERRQKALEAAVASNDAAAIQRRYGELVATRELFSLLVSKGT